MKKFLSVILCATVALTLTACRNEEQRQKQIASYAREQHEKEQSEYWESREAEISEVDEWGVSLDDVERLAKDAIRKNEMEAEYKSDYNKIVKEIDTFLSDIKNGKAVQYDLNYLLKKHGEVCQAGIRYIESHVGDNVKWQYDLSMDDGELDKIDKDLIRDMLTLWNNSIQKIQQSETDMKTFLEPIISENRKLTDEEIQKVFEIYHILTDIILKVN